MAVHPCMEWIPIKKKVSCKSVLWRTIYPSLAAYCELLGHCWYVARLSFFYRYFFGRYSSELAQLIPLSYFHERTTFYSDRWHDFSVTIPRCYKDVYVCSFFLCTAWLWNSVPLECFPLSYDQNGFKSIVNRYHLSVAFF